MHYQWDFAIVWKYKTMLLVGLLHTVELSIMALILGLCIGLIMTGLRMGENTLLRWFARLYINFFRNTPPLVHLFWFFYAFPILVGLSLSAYWAAAIALGIQSGAFYAEVFRGGILSIHPGQWEGAKALGMGRLQSLRRIILPQAISRMIGPFIERTFELIKTTSLASTLAYADILYQAMQISSITFRPLEVYTVVALIYFLFLLCLSLLSKCVEYRFKRI